MRIGRRASTLGAGVLAVAIGAALPLVMAEAAMAADCDRGGLLPGVTDTLCKVVDGATDVVDDVTKGGLGDVTDTVDKVVGGVTGSDDSKSSSAPGQNKDSGKPEKDQEKESSTGVETGTSDGGSVDVCASSCGHSPAPTLDAEPVRVKPSDPAESTEPATSGRRDDRRERRPEPRPQFVTSGEPITASPEPTPPPVAEPEPVRVDEVAPPLLWPGQLIPELMSDTRKVPVRPRQAYDPVATGLTTLLLVSAVLAARVAWLKRARKEELEAMCPESLPLSGLPTASRRRQRIA
ncbi:hypothetical protein FDA94_33035 [Herbidospora galbida]|uniref:Uncharacterized protein n=1 Tax=Herbidospora galbida TaxID=2575442 RepID=A0A4U3M4E3_9ACTN|nr:hypothetical protein [Herbidospora galbida]TKK83678.1 hypothetical protein FDA94_33035 [Herbidospora galbida]